MSSENKRIQVISCKCGKTFAASIEPECYKDKEWMDNLREYVTNGCSVDLIKSGEGNLKLEECICTDKISIYHEEEKITLDDCSNAELISEVKSRNRHGALYQSDINSILTHFDAVPSDEIEPYVIETHSIIDEMKLEHIANIFHKYSLEYFEYHFK